MKTILRSALGLIVLFLVACSSDPAGIPTRTVVSVTVAPAAKTLTIGDTLRMLVYPKTATGEVLGGLLTAWQSDNVTIASISAAGTVTAKAPGTTRITATVGGKTGETTVSVTAAELPVATIEIATLPAQLVVGQQVNIEAILKAADGTVIGGRPVVWRSNNGPALTVDSYNQSPFALVTAHAVGQATITAEAGGRAASLVVTVNPRPPVVGSVIPTPSKRTMWLGETFTFSAAVLGPTGGTIPNPPAITWTVEDTEIATIDASGKAHGRKPGTTRITAESGGISGTATLTVLPSANGVINTVLIPTIDEHGNPRVAVVIGTTTWTDASGTVWPATIVVTGGTMKVSFHAPNHNYEQKLFTETRVFDARTGIMQIVARDTINDHGLFSYEGSTNNGGTVTFVFNSHALPYGPFEGKQPEAGVMHVRRKIGTAPVLAYVWNVQG